MENLINYLLIFGQLNQQQIDLVKQKARKIKLKKEEYFDVIKFPNLSFISTKITVGSASGTYIMVGKMTIKGISKEITFPFTAHAQGDGYQFSGSFPLNRRDFGVGGKSMILSDNLTVLLVVLAEKAK